MMANPNAYCPGNGIGFEPGDFDAPLRQIRKSSLPKAFTIIKPDISSDVRKMEEQLYRLVP